MWALWLLKPQVSDDFQAGVPPPSPTRGVRRVLGLRGAFRGF